MSDSAEFNLWLKQLECPQIYTSDHVKNLLHRGVLGLIWEDIPKNIRPFTEVSEVRKNILLYKLKNESKDHLIQNIRNTVILREKREKLDSEIKNAEDRWKKQEFICRQKAHTLEKKKAERKNLALKKDILKIKHEQMLMQIENCKKMQEICNHLMPPAIEEIPQTVIIDCLSLVSNYSGGPEKRKVWNTISESLTPVKIPVLWNALLAARSHYTDLLIQLDIEENPESKRNNNVASIDIGIAKMCSEHLDNVARRFIYSGRMKNNEEETIEYVEKIEQIIEELRPDLTDWLPLALEVKKLEILQTELQKEAAKLEEQLSEDDVMIDDTLMLLITEIKSVDNRTVDCVQEIQNALGLLKSSGTLITKTKESLLTELEKFQLLQTNEENSWQDIDLQTELIDFHTNIDINSLRKIMLKGEIGVYKHLQTCMNQASTIIEAPRRDEFISNFPILRAPIYYLIDYYKTFVVNASLTKRLIIDDVLDVQEDIPISPLESPTISVSPKGIFELLRATDMACKKTKQHSEEFDRTLKTWSNQSVRDVVSMIFRDKTVYGATLDEWKKRFSMIVYYLQKANIHVT